MVSQTIKVVYENGVFRPLTPPELQIEEGDEVFVTVEHRLSPKEMTKLAASVYEGLSEEEIKEIERIALDRTHFFGDRASV